jgi:hypothetical protein
VGAPLLPVALLLVLTSCGLLPADEDGLPTAQSAGSVVEDRIDRLLTVRARAVRERDDAAWRRTVATGRDARPGSQRLRFANLVQLPIATLEHRVDPTTVVRSDGAWHAVVSTRLQLDGYDRVPVARSSRYRFVEDPDGRGLLVAADRDPAWERRHDVERQPWDRGRVHVRTGGGVLGIFDPGSVDHADEVLAAVEQGIEEVSAQVPWAWSRSVVVYALSHTSMLGDLDSLPSGDPDRIDAVAFPVTAADDGERLAGTRFLLHPRMLSADRAALARLIRHELTHVALAGRDDEAPLWLGEGIAEWVSVRSVPADQRLISRAAVRAARQGRTRLPDDTTFNRDGSGEDYGLSWWACQAVVDMYGAPVLWALLDDLGSAPATQHDRLLEERLGLTEAQLAAEATRRILATYG